MQDLERVPEPDTEEWTAFVHKMDQRIQDAMRDAVAAWLAPTTGEEWAHKFAYELPFETIQWIHSHFPHRDEAGEPAVFTCTAELESP